MPLSDHPANLAVFDDRITTKDFFDAVVQALNCSAIALQGLRAFEAVHCANNISDHSYFGAGAGQ